MNKHTFAIISLSFSIVTSLIGQESKEAKEIGEAELAKYVIKCGESWYAKRIVHGPFELKRNGTSILVPKMLSESDKLNGIEYLAVLKYSYHGPHREYKFATPNSKGWSEWTEANINIDIWIQKKNGNWRVELSNDPFLGSGYVKVMCEDLAELEIEIDIKNIRNIDELEILDKRVLSTLADVENAYNRRVGIIADLLKTMDGPTVSLKERCDVVNKALLDARKVHLDETTVNDMSALSNYLQIQNELSSATSGLLIVLDGDPELLVNKNIRDVRVLLEGVENRIMSERRRYNELVEAFNLWRLRLNAGSRFKEKRYISAYLLKPSK